MSACFAMAVAVPSGVSAGQGDGPERDLVARVAAGPGLWDDSGWLGEARRDGLIAELLVSGAIGLAASAGHRCRLERALTAAMTLLCVITCCLFTGQGRDMVLARAFRMPRTRVRPGTPVPTGPALSQALRRAAPRLRAGRGEGRRPAGGGRDRLRPGAGHLRRHVAGPVRLPRSWRRSSASPPAALTRSCGPSRCCRQGTMRWKAAALGGYHDGENALADRLGGALGPGQLSLADCGFFSTGRWLRFSAAGPHLLWRVKSTARAVPFRQLRILKDGSELVLLRESGNTLAKRRKDAVDRALARLPGTIARFVCYTVLPHTRRGRAKSTARYRSPSNRNGRSDARQAGLQAQRSQALLQQAQAVTRSGLTLRRACRDLPRQPRPPPHHHHYHQLTHMVDSTRPGLCG